MKMINNVKFHQKFYIIPMIMNLWSQKSFFCLQNSLLLNTISPNSNALEWILWRKWDDWSWTSMAFKVAKRFFNQNYTSFSFLLPLFITTYRAVKNLRIGFTQSLNIATLFILSPPPMKLRICPWTLKHYEFATRLKISYLHSNLSK